MFDDDKINKYYESYKILINKGGGLLFDSSKENVMIDMLREINKIKEEKYGFKN